jgi:hypothetical protein
VGLAKCCGQTDGYAQEASQIDRVSLVLLDYPIQRLTIWILKNEDRSPLVTSQRNRLSFWNTPRKSASVQRCSRLLAVSTVANRLSHSFIRSDRLCLWQVAV